MKQNIKSEFVTRYGQEQWSLLDAYRNGGDRSPEATNAKRLYRQIERGMTTDIFNVYGIVYEGEVIYVGCTSMTINERFIKHKSIARKLPQVGTAAIHCFMNENTTDLQHFSDFVAVQLSQATTQDEANDLEQHFIDTLNPKLNMRNGGGGCKSKLKGTFDDISIRPACDQEGVVTR
jgi:hypothetical protein